MNHRTFEASMSMSLRAAFLCLGVGLSLLGGTLSAQDAEARKLLEKAEDVKRLEQDHEAAIRHCRSALAVDGVGDAVRSRALLLLSVCLEEIGKADEAREALQEAARGEGAAAEEASRILDGKAEYERKLVVHVTQILQKMRKPDDVSQGQLNHLVTLGDPVVPYIVEALQAERSHVVIRSLASALLTIGSEAAAKYVEGVMGSNDRFLQQVFLSEADKLEPNLPTTEIRRAFLPLVSSGEAKTRDEALRHCVEAMTRDEILGLIQSEKKDLRIVGLDRAAERGFLSDSEAAPAVIDLARAFFASGDPEEVEAFQEVVRSRDLQKTREGQLFALEIVAAGLGADMRHGGAAVTLRPEDFLQVEPKIANMTRGSTRQSALNELSRLLDRSKRTWEWDDFPQVRRLVEGGVMGGILESWVTEHAGAEHVPAVIELLRFDSELPQDHSIVQWLHEQEWDEAAVGVVAKHIDSGTFRNRWFHGWNPGSKYTRGRAHRVRSSGKTSLAYKVASVEGRAASELLVRLADIDPDEMRYWVAQAVYDSPALHIDVCRYLLRQAETENVKHVDVLFFLARKGVLVEEALHVLGKVPVGKFGYLQLVVDGTYSGKESLYTDAQVAQILEAVLQDGSPDWEYVANDVLQRLRRRSKLASEISKVLHERALEAPTRDLRATFVRTLMRSTEGEKQKTDLRRRVLRGGEVELMREVAEYAPVNEGDAEWLRPLLTHEDWRVVFNALRRMEALRGEEYLGWLRPCLKNAHAGVRSAAVRQVYDLSGDEILDEVLPLSEDPDSNVRNSVCAVLGRSLSPRAAEVLIDLLRDSDSDVSQSAKASLERIERYYDHKQRWERWRDEFSLEADDPAEALLRQAGKESPKRVRLAAIRSLGALAVAETMPFLIRLMVDEDADVAAAAEKALLKVQDRLENEPPRRLERRESESPEPAEAESGKPE